MGSIVLSLILAILMPALQQGEKPVDSNSLRITVTGCLRGRNLIAMEPKAGEPVGVRVESGKLFRLSGSKTVMKDLGKYDKSAVEVTGLVRKAALDPSAQGMPIGAGGRIRIGGTPMNQDPTRVDARRAPLANVDVFDVESLRPANEVCPTK